MRRKARGGSVEAEDPIINLTPLIDVVFVVLIMFILAAPLLEMDHIELAGGQEDANHAFSNENGPVCVYVLYDNTVWVDNRRVDYKELNEFLMEAKRKYPRKRPRIFHDRRAQFGTYQTIKNAVEAAGFSEMDIVLKPA